VVLRASGHRDLIRWIGARYRIWRVHPGWYVVAGLLAPAITLLSLGVRALADPDFRIAPQSPLGEMVGEIGAVGVALVLPLMTVGLVASSPLLEEFGWRGFALPALQARWNALTSSIVLGVAWWVWQLPLFVAYGDSLVHSLLLIVPQTILMTWLVNSARGSMVIALLFHAGLVVALTPLYAGSRSVVEIVLTWLVTIAVIQRCGPRDLSKAMRVSLPPVTSLLPESR
jgi:membrane protease YdiL (CAAX protease family)